MLEALESKLRDWEITVVERLELPARVEGTQGIPDAYRAGRACAERRVDPMHALAAPALGEAQRCERRPMSGRPDKSMTRLQGEAVIP